MCRTNEAPKRARIVLHEFENKRLAVKRLSGLSRVSQHPIYDRLRKAWPMEAALNPVKLQRR